jgi:hypothetical protein
MPTRTRSRKTNTRRKITRTLDARPDTLDFRDKMFEPTLIEVPVRQPLGAYRKRKVPILDQGQEGACTGFGLATVVHYLLRTRAVVSDRVEVSPRMLYDMARRYDEWPGEKYEGSSARGAMKAGTSTASARACTGSIRGSRTQRDSRSASRMRCSVRLAPTSA